MKRILSIALAAIASVVALAQKPTINFETETHNFGEIREENGPVSFEFKFKNGGKTPLVINHAQASCGCTTPEFTRTPVQPGGEGVVKVTFNPANRPGVFEKNIAVNSNADRTVVNLKISGKVLERPKTIEDEYPVLMEGLRLTENSLSFTSIHPDETKNAEINVINTSDHDISVEFINVPQHIKIVCQPATLKAGEKGVILANYDAAKKNDWGFVSDRIYINFNGKRDYKNSLTASATITEDFSKVTDANAPVAEYEEKNFDFGDIPQTEKVSHNFTVKNTGKSPLIIRKVKASCGCTAVAPEKTTLAPGETTQILVTFDPRGKSGRQSKNVTVITNDPKSTNVMLRITSNVLVPGADIVK